jgi:hypothetical protein
VSRLLAWPKALLPSNVSGCPMVSQAAAGDTTSHIAEFYATAVRDDKAGALAGFVDAAGNLAVSGATKVVKAVSQTTLTAAQINAMYTTPVAVIPAPASGQAIVVDAILVELDLTATQFAAGGVVHFYYHGLTVELMAQTLAASAVIGSASPSQVLMLLEPVQTSGGSVVTPAVGVDITNATQVFTTGTGTAKITCWYNIVTLG